MSYELTLRKAGATVLAYKEVGDYQGTWGCVVEYKGKLGLVTGSYGSCSGCDAFQGEFGWGGNHDFSERNGKYYKWYDEEITKEEYEQGIAEHERKLAQFGEGYLNDIQDAFDIENRLANTHPDVWYDEEIRELLTWALPLIK